MVFGGVTKYQGNKSWVVRHSLSLVLVALLVVQSVAYWLLEWPDWSTQQKVHGQAAGLAGFAQHYWAEWMVSVLADTYGALIIVLLSKWFYEQGSKESHDPEEATA